jgi:PAS domain S-box-containing protein
MISVLYVDDEPDLLRIGKRYLERSRQFSVSTVDSAPSALSLLEEQRFDVIISDYQMPEMDGLEFLKQVRRLHGLIPFILFTGRGREEVVILALNLGADFYLQKGGNPRPQYAELAQMIRQAVQRRLAEISLQESERRYHEVVENQSEFISRFLPDGTQIFANEAFCRYYGKRRHEVIGHRFRPEIPEEDRDAVRRHFSSFTRDRPAAEIEHRVVMPDGTARWQWWNDRAVFDDQGRIVEFQSIGKDITDRKWAEEALEKSESRWKLWLDQSPVPMALYTLDGEVILTNRQFGRAIGWTSDDIRHVDDWWHLVYPDPQYREQERGAWMDRCMRSVSRGETIEPQATRIRCKDGHTRVLEFSGLVVGNEVLVTYYDLTASRQEAEALRRSEREYRSIVENLPVPFYRTDMQGALVMANASCARLFGYSGPAELLGRSIADTLCLDPGEWHAFLRELDRTGDVREYRIAMRRREGETVVVTASCHYVYDGNGERIGIEGMLRVIETIPVAQDSRKERDDFTRGLVEKIPDMVVVYGHDRKIRYVNPAVTRMLGYSTAELQGTDLMEYVVPEQRAKIVAVIARRIATGSVEPVEVEFLGKEGQRLTVITNGTSIRYHEEPAVLLVLNDITDLKALEIEMKYHEQELIQFYRVLGAVNNKLSLLSSITRHDISNQLTVLQGIVSLLEEEKMPQGHPRREYIRQLSIAAGRIADMIRFTKEYESIGVQDPAWQSCRRLVDAAAKEAPLGGAVVKNEISPGAEVYADPLIVKVFYNLMDNAARYGLRTTTIRFFAEESGDRAVLVCEDDGVGVPAADKARIFERGVGKNTGMGLFLSTEILAISGITIAETGEPGRGARFELAVPKEMFRFVTD